MYEKEHSVLKGLKSLKAEEIDLNIIIDRIRNLNGVLANAETHISEQHAIVEGARLALITAIIVVKHIIEGSIERTKTKEALDMLISALARIDKMNTTKEIVDVKDE